MKENMNFASPLLVLPLYSFTSPSPPVRRMISDVQLAVFVNILGVSLFLMVVLYHYIAANNPKSH